MSDTHLWIDLSKLPAPTPKDPLPWEYFATNLTIIGWRVATLEELLAKYISEQGRFLDLIERFTLVMEESKKKYAELQGMLQTHQLIPYKPPRTPSCWKLTEWNLLDSAIPPPTERGPFRMEWF